MLHDGVNRSCEVPPFDLPLGQCSVPRPRELVHASTAPADLCPPTRKQSVTFKPMKRRIQGAFGQIERAMASSTQRLRDRVPVRWIPLNRRE